MSRHCTSCGNPVPAGQFRCGRCGAPQEDEETDGPADEAEAEAAGESPGSSSNPPPAEPGAAAAHGESRARADSALSLPPPAPEQEELELDHGEADDSARRSDPAVDGFDREDDTEKRKIVPKGAFGDGSVAEKLPAAETAEARANAEGDEEARAASKPPEATSSEVKGKVARLPGLEPTRHAGDDEEEKAAKEQEASEPETEETAEDDEESSSDEAPLELDLPSGGIRSLPHKPRPPFLASELMREEIIPERPGAHAIARLSQSCGVAAVVAYMLLLVVRPDAVLWGIPALLLLALGVLRLRYLLRAAGLSALTLGATLACASNAPQAGGFSHARYLPFVVLWLSASLLLRFWYRGHRQPPWLVAGGVAAAAALGVSTLGEAGPWVLSSQWQSWLPALVGLLFAQLCLLSLFAFMGPETNAAGATWAIAWWAWYAAAHVVFALARATRVDEGLSLAAAAEALTQSGLILAFLVPPGSFAFAQLYAMALSRHEPAAADDPHITPA